MTRVPSCYNDEDAYAAVDNYSHIEVNINCNSHRVE